MLYLVANRRAFLALFEGDPARARHCQQQAPRGDFGSTFQYLARWGEVAIGLSYLWEGQVILTESLLKPALASAEGDLGRRDPLTSMIAPMLAAAVWEQDRPQEAAALLAHRLDVLERRGFPEAVLLAYRTAARVATAEGAEHRALDFLEGLHAAGLSRNLPRLCIASLADQVRMHARRFRQETCRSLCDRIDTMLADDAVPKGRLWRQSVEWMRHLAHANAAIAGQDWRGALEPLARAGAIAESMRLGRVRIEVMALRAFALDRSGEKALPLLREAIDLAATYGLKRLFEDAHPMLGDWVARVSPNEAAGLHEPRRRAPAGAPSRGHGTARNTEPGVDPQGARSSRTARSQLVEQGDRARDAGRRRDDQVAPEEPVRQARRRQSQAGGSARTATWAARNSALIRAPAPAPSARGGVGPPPPPNLRVIRVHEPATTP